VKVLVKALTPHGVILGKRSLNEMRQRRTEQKRREKFLGRKQAVAETVGRIRQLSATQCRDVRFLEHDFIPSLGLNDEMLHEQPGELSKYFGQGLHIWQYPSQLARYLAWIAQHAPGVASYAEIGCRWGGMFILISEWLRRHGADLRQVVAIDPIAPTPFIDEYFSFLRSAHPETESVYVQDFSTSSQAKMTLARIKPRFVFIDGDHSLRGALEDHMLVRDTAQIIVHHDICSDACADTKYLWSVLKRLEAQEFEVEEFGDQYASVRGDFLGIGVLRRKSEAPAHILPAQGDRSATSGPIGLLA
jgi:hypothetical protein